MRKPIIITSVVLAVAIVAGAAALGLARRGAAPAAAPSPTPSTSTTATPTGDASRAFASTRLYLDPNTEAAAAAARFEQQGDTASSLIAGRIADIPTAVWLGEWFQGDRLVTELRNDVADARAQQATPVFVAYAIPNRDCGGYSKGGLAPDQYLPWMRTIASTLRGSHAVVLLEPDSLGMLADKKCDGSAEVRLPLLKASVGILEGRASRPISTAATRAGSPLGPGGLAGEGRSAGSARLLHERLQLRHDVA
ncbi:glycoside hydrolase family 6 protein [Leifsonia xyli]|uniref:glycoside hydrolase family 6 protein n=1 Tax=Leifsonia xyli TaxID=1575 RepID=UPI003D67AAD8